jgi:hypothetical protein
MRIRIHNTRSPCFRKQTLIFIKLFFKTPLLRRGNHPYEIMKEGEDLDPEPGVHAAALLPLEDLFEEVEPAVPEERVLGLGEVAQEGGQRVECLQRYCRAAE